MGRENITFKLDIVELKGSKDYFLEGFVSTTDPDSLNDIVDSSAQPKIVEQMLEYNITMDEDHDVFRDPKTGKTYDRPRNKIPAGKVVDAKLKTTSEGSLGTWVRVKLNKDYPLFDKLLNSVKNKFLHSLSIAYNVTKGFSKKVDGKVYRIIEDLEIFNFGITAAPVNKKAKINLALKSFSKMEDVKQDTAKAEVKSEVPEVQAEVQAETVVEETAELKADMDYGAMYKGMKDMMMSDMKNYMGDMMKAEMKNLMSADVIEPMMKAYMDKNMPKAEMKSEVSNELTENIDTIKSELAEVKSILEKPMIKGNLDKKVEVKSQSRELEINDFVNNMFK